MRMHAVPLRCRRVTPTLIALIAAVTGACATAAAPGAVSGPAAPAEAGPESAPDSAELAAEPAPEPVPEGRCRYRVQDASMRVQLGSDHSLGVTAEEATLVVASSEPGLQAFVRGSLRFQGTYPVWMFSTATATPIDGFGVIPAGTPLHGVEAGEAGVVPTVSISWTAPASPYSLDGPMSYEAQITLPEQPCEGIAPQSQVVGRPRTDLTVTGDLVFGPSEVVLRERPDQGRELRLRSPSAVALFSVERRRDWTRVRVPSSYGAELEGWVPTRMLGRVGPPGLRGALLAGLPQAEPEGRPMRARLRPGAPVFAAPDQMTWATVGTAAAFDVRAVTPEAPWLLIETAPGIEIVGSDDPSGRLGRHRMWVRRQDVLELQPRP